VAVLAVMLAVGSFASMVPNGYTDRLLTIVHNDKDETNSAQQRRELLDRAIEVAANHLVLGIGIGNFSYYSLHNKAAHNAFVEISAELGVAGLGAYLILILAPIRNLRRIERANAGSRDPDKREMYFLSVGVQSAIASYLVCSFFGSVQYQWFIYYIAAYAVSLRCLEAKAVEPLAAAATRSPAKVSGMVWRSQQTAAEGRTGARW
jgi:O-antigen ligase